MRVPRKLKKRRKKAFEAIQKAISARMVYVEKYLRWTRLVNSRLEQKFQNGGVIYEGDELLLPRRS